MRGWVWALVPVLGACSSGFPAIERSALPTAEEHDEHDAAFAQDSVELRFVSTADGPALRRRHRRRIVIFDPRGSEAAGLVAGYRESFGEVRYVRARVVRPDGSEERFGRSDMADLPAIQGNLYSDYRFVAKDFGTLPAGTVVDWEAEVEWNNPSWSVSRHAFGYRVPVLDARFEVHVPEGWAVDHTARQHWRALGLDPEIEQTSEGTRYRWARRDLAAVPKEPYAPSIEDSAPLVYVRLARWRQGDRVEHAFGTLEDYGRWMHGVQAGTDTPTPELQAATARVLAGVGRDPESRARALYEWVQKEVRYVSVQIGMGGWRPTDAKHVLQYGYGDCKDKANLLRAMLSVAGIESHLVELFSHQGRPRPFVLPGVGNGNHAILAVQLPDRVVLADPTERAVPFGKLPPRDQGAEVLVLNPERPQLVRTPVDPASENVKELRVELEVPERGVAGEGRVRLRTRGPFAWSLRHQVVTAAEGEEDDIFAGWNWIVGGDARDVRLDVSSPAEVSGQARVRVPRIGSQAGARMVFRPDAVLRTPGHDLPRAERTQPVVFPTAVTRDTELRLVLGGAQVGGLPGPVRVESPFGRFEQQWRLEDDALVVASRFERTARDVPAARYEELLAFFDAIVQARGQSVVIRRGGER